VGKCIACKATLPPNSSSRRRYCDKCVRARQVKAGKDRKGIPYLPGSYHVCQLCGDMFMAKVDTSRTLCNTCLKVRQTEVYKANLPKINEAIKKNREVRGMWYTCECGSAVTWKHTRINKEGTLMVGVEKCPVCGVEASINVPVTEYCARCNAPLMAKKGTRVKHCADCTKYLKKQELMAYLDGLVGKEITATVIENRHTLIQRLKELDKLL
jgi:hypothetical protein